VRGMVPSLKRKFKKVFEGFCKTKQKFKKVKTYDKKKKTST